MTYDDTRSSTVAERLDILSLLRELDDEHWQRLTKCAGWSVSDVVAHLTAWDQLMMYTPRSRYVSSVLRWTATMTCAGFDPHRVNARQVANCAGLRPDEILRRFAAQSREGPRWLFDRIAPGAQLAEYVLHHEDIRDAVERPRVIPASRLRHALDGVRRLPALPAKSRLRQNRWIATDLDWAAGRGPEVRLPARDVLLELSGRHALT
jgi:uncharacterized protein (TIGR03083 family)